MKNIFLYTITVLIWGTTWLAIEFQLGEVAVEVSLVYRFGLAGLLILIFSKFTGASLHFTLKQHLSIALLGLLNFSVNYALLYEAQKYLSSAITSVVFSALLLMNIINTRIFFGKKILPKTYFGALTGLAGIVILFWPEIQNYQATSYTALGLALGLLGSLSASFGNMISVRNSSRNYPVLQSSGWGMLYGSGFLLFFALVNGAEFTVSSKPSYWLSLAYLTVFGSVIAFYSYFMLLKNIGTEKTSYAIVLFPLIAVILSSIFEGFQWTPFTLAGFVFILGGNLIVLIPKGWFKRIFNLLVSPAKTVAELDPVCPEEKLKAS